MSENYFEWLLEELQERTGDLLVDEIKALRQRKRKDYGSQSDHLANYRASEEIGIPAWKNIVLRMMEKWARIKTIAKRDGVAVNEPFRDALIDNAVMSLLVVQLLDQGAVKQADVVVTPQQHQSLFKASGGLTVTLKNEATEMGVPEPETFLKSPEE